MPVIKRSIVSGLPVATVFDYVAKFENIVQWDPGVVACRKATEGRVRIGSTYDLDLRYESTELTMTYTVMELAAPSLIVLYGEGSRSVATDRIGFVADGSGTRVDYEAEIRLKGLFRVAEPFLGGLFARVGDGAQQGLELRLNEMERSDL